MAFVDPDESGAEGDTTTAITDAPDHMAACRAGTESGKSQKVEVAEGRCKYTTQDSGL